MKENPQNNGCALNQDLLTVSNKKRALTSHYCMRGKKLTKNKKSENLLMHKKTTGEKIEFIESPRNIQLNFDGEDFGSKIYIVKKIENLLILTTMNDIWTPKTRLKLKSNS